MSTTTTTTMSTSSDHSGSGISSSTLSAHTYRTSRSLQYEQHHTQFSDPMITVYQHLDHYDSTSSWETNLTVANESNFEFAGEFAASSDSGNAGDTLIVVCTLFVPLAIAISAILIIALLIRRMRRAESMQEIDDEEKCTGGTLQPNSHSQSYSSHYYSQEISTSTEDLPHSVALAQKSAEYQHQLALSPSYILNNKKSVPLPVILGLVEPDDAPPTLEPSSVVIQDEVSNQHRRGSQGLTVLSEASRNGRPPRTPSQSIPCNGNGNGSTSGNYHNNVVDSVNNSMYRMSSSNNSLNAPGGGGGGVGGASSVSPSKSSFSDRVLNVLHFPKRLKEQQAEKKRFNIYTVSLETREQLKQIYVY